MTTAILSTGSSALAQSATASLSGTAIDESRAVVPNVEGTVVNLDTYLERRVKTNDSGFFSVPFLNPGHYAVTAVREGFSKVEIRDVILNIDDQRSVTLQLKIGGPTESVVVVGSPGTTNTQTPAVA